MRRTPWTGLLAALALAGCGEVEEPLRIGSKDFTEQLILGELIAQVAESEGIPVDRSIPYGGTFENIEALKRGDIDVYPEYNGTGLVLLGQPPMSDGDAAYRRVEELYEPLGLDWGERLGFANDYEIVMLAERADELGIETISDLSELEGPIRFGIDREFQERPVDGFAPMLRRYGLNGEAALITEATGTGKGQLYESLLGGEVDVVEAFSTDGQIAEYGLKVLEDDLEFFPTYQPAPLAREGALERFASLDVALGKLGGLIDTGAMREMNAAVELEGQEPAAVARRFLAENGVVAAGADVAQVEQLRLAVGPLDSESAQIMTALKATRQTFPGRDVEVAEVADPIRTLTAGDARLALVDATAFFNLTDGVFPQQDVPAQALGVVGYDMAHILVRADSDLNALGDVRTLGVGPAGGASERIATMVLTSLGLDGAVQLEAAALADAAEPLPSQARALRGGEIDALFLMAAEGHPGIREIMAGGGLRLLSLLEWQDGNNLVRFPFLRLSRIPAGSYQGQEEPVDTIGAQVVLAGPAGVAAPVGAAGPGSAAIGEIQPIADKSIQELNAALASSEQLDPALPSPGILRPQAKPQPASIHPSTSHSVVNLLVILISIYLAYLYFRKPPRRRVPSLRAPAGRAPAAADDASLGERHV